MNIHPLLVHFPIALLSIYSVMEILRIKALTGQEWWFYTKSAFLLLGSASTAPTVLAGKLAEGNFPDARYLVEVHSTWAQATSVIFVLLSFCYFVAILDKHVIFGINPSKLFPAPWGLAVKLEKFVLETFVVVPIVLAGLMAIVVTGALGGAIVYGKNLDPFTVFIYNLLVGN